MYINGFDVSGGNIKCNIKIKANADLISGTPDNLKTIKSASGNNLRLNKDEGIFMEAELFLRRYSYPKETALDLPSGDNIIVDLYYQYFGQRQSSSITYLIKYYKFKSSCFSLNDASYVSPEQSASELFLIVDKNDMICGKPDIKKCISFK